MAIAAIVVLFVAAWFAFSGTGKPAPTAAQPAPAPAVGVRPAATRPVSRSFEFVGRIKAVNIVEVRARIEGFLDKVLFTEGQDVKAGDLLYQIEKVQFQSALDQAKANLLVAEAAVVNAKLAVRPPARPGEAAVHAAVACSTRTRPTSTPPTAARCRPRPRSPRRRPISTTPTSARRSTAASAAPRYTVGNLVNPASGVLATIVSQDPIYVLFPVSVSELETIREARRKEGGGLAKIEIGVRLPTARTTRSSGTWNLTDPQVDQTDRQPDHAGDHCPIPTAC